MYKIAVAANIIHLLYFLVTTNVDLYPFNNIRSFTKQQRLIEISIHGPLMLFCIIALLLDKQVLVTIAVSYLGFLIIGEFLSWWRHYFFKPTPEWKDLYNRVFKETITILPPIKDHPVPNLEHCILHLITVCTFMFTLIYKLSS